MSDLPENLRYTKDHEWARLESDGTVTVGITQHAVDQLGDITAVSLPSAGDRLAAHDRFGDIDSVKAVSDLYAPIEGEVVAINGDLDRTPESVNEDPYGKGWMIRIKPASADALAGLLDARAYADLIA
ncbi:glycine cleavage system protein GcvH [Nannocystaceae bacterium ST9]